MDKKTRWAAGYLPAHYDLCERIDLTRDDKALKSICIWSIVALVVMIGYGLLTHSFVASFDMELWRIFFCLVATAAGMLVYIVLHEGIHGIFIKFFTGENPSFGIKLSKGMAYAGSTWYFKKWPYIIIALSPIVIWGVVLSLWLGDIPPQYYWYLYMIQIFNITGGAGDLFVTCRILSMPKEILIKDTGMAMEIYRSL